MGSQNEHLLGGRFRIEREVGRGAVGVIYRAFDVETQATVALKVIAADVGVAPAEEARLKREGQVLTGLDHPGIVKIVAHGVSDHTGQPWVAMEWLDGEDLEARQRRSPLSLAESILLIQLVAEALHCAHKLGVVHRDIKPGNIYLCGAVDGAIGEECMPKLVDFGIARADQTQASFGSIAKVTRVGDVVGTPAYMAPEQARTDGTIDTRSDIYSLGALLFELAAGRPPHVGTSAIATLARLVTTPPPKLRDLKPEIPSSLSDLVSDMLETDAERRPQSAQQVAMALRDVSKDAHRNSVPPLSMDAPVSARLGSSASRLVTTIVAIGFTKDSLRQRALGHLSDRGAVAVPLGKDTLVAHLGARRASGTEASAALDLGRRLARAAAQVGVASGRAQVAQVGSSGELRPVGEVVDRASSLAREASPGMVLADTTTAELGRGRYEFLSRDDGSAIVGEAMRAGRERVGGAPFVGRDAELRQMLSAFERCQRDGRPAIVTVTGLPGIGKSRLRREFLARITSGAEIEVILQRSEAYGRAQALGAAAGLLRAVIGLSKGVSLEEADAAISTHLGDRHVDAVHRSVLAALLANQPLPEGVDPRSVRDALWLSMTELVKLSVGSSPTVIVTDDMQWADSESIDWLEHMLGRLDGTPLFVLALMRPSFWTEYDQTFAGKDHTRLELRPISARATLAIARAMLGEGVPDDVLERIAAQSGGLPLFAEELARLTGAGGDASSAPTIEAAIQASLDALDDETRDAIGRLSVLGLTVWGDALEALGISPAEPVMKELAAAEILVEQQTSSSRPTRPGPSSPPSPAIRPGPRSRCSAVSVAESTRKRRTAIGSPIRSSTIASPVPPRSPARFRPRPNRRPRSRYRRHVQRELFRIAANRENEDEAVFLYQLALSAQPHGKTALEAGREILQFRVERNEKRRPIERELWSIVSDYDSLITVARRIEPDGDLLGRLVAERDSVDAVRLKGEAEFLGALDRDVRATSHLRAFVENYPDRERYSEMLFHLGENYRRSGRADDAVGAFLDLWTEHPESPWWDAARTVLPGLVDRMEEPVMVERLLRAGLPDTLTARAGTRMDSLVVSVDSMQDAAVFLDRFPASDYAPAMQRRLEEKADEAYREARILEGVARQQRALDSYHRILFLAPESPAADLSRHRIDALVRSG